MTTRRRESVVLVLVVVVNGVVAGGAAHAPLYGDLIGAEAAPAASPLDLTPSATYGHGGGNGGSKFFMYAHQPAKKEYEFGFKVGNDYHTVERYEKGGPHHNFKTKVRWGDAKGGHGEHYWDYNHAPKYRDDHGDDYHGHGDDYHGDDHYGHDDHGGDHGGYHSQPVPDYAPSASATTVTATAAVPQESGWEARVSNPSITYRRRRKPKSNKAGLKKDTGLDKKNKYQYYNEKQTFEYQLSSSDHEATLGDKDSPSAFPQMLDYNPYLPPEISKEPFFAQAAPSFFSNSRAPERVTPPARTLPKSKVSASSSRYSNSKPQYTTTTPFGPRAGVGANLTRSPKIGNSKIKEINSSPLTPSGLSFDAETGRVYNKDTGMWYSLVLVKQA